MTLQGSGAISLANIRDEFGGSGAVSLGDYYGAADSITRSGAISIGNFHGKSNYYVAQHKFFESGLTVGDNGSYGIANGNDDGTAIFTGSASIPNNMVPHVGIIAKHDGAGIVWARHFEMEKYPYYWDGSFGGGSSYDGVSTRFVKSATDSTGIYAAGESRGYVRGTNIENLFVVKYNHSGTVQWAKACATGPVSNNKSAMSVSEVAVDSNNVYVCGGIGNSSSDRTWRAKWDEAYVWAFNKSTGALNWKYHIDHDRMFVGVHTFDDGYVYLCMQDTRRSSITKLNTSGTLQWVKQYGDGFMKAHCMIGAYQGSTKYLWLAGESGGGSYESGSWLKINTDGGMEWEGTLSNLDMPAFTSSRRLVHAADSDDHIIFLWNIAHYATNSSTKYRGLLTRIRKSDGVCVKQVALVNNVDSGTPAQLWGGITMVRHNGKERYLAVTTQADDNSANNQVWIIRIPADLVTHNGSGTQATFSTWEFWNLDSGASSNDGIPYSYSTFDQNPRNTTTARFYDSDNAQDYSSSLDLNPSYNHFCVTATTSGMMQYLARNADFTNERKTHINAP